MEDTCQVVSLDEYRQACRERDEWKQKATYYQNKWAEETARANGLHKHLMFYENSEAVPTTQIKPTDKAVARALVELESKKQPGENKLMPIYRVEISERTGIPEQTVSASLARLKKMKVIAHECKRVRNEETGGFDNAMYARTNPKWIENPVAFNYHHEDKNGNETDSNAWGGKRYACKTCKSLNTVSRNVVEVICRDCGCTHNIDEHDKHDKPFIINDEETFRTWNEHYHPTIDDTMSAHAVEPTGDDSNDATATDEGNTGSMGMVHSAETDRSEQDVLSVLTVLHRPIACHCGIRTRWFSTETGTHCRVCEIGYANYQIA